MSKKTAFLYFIAFLILNTLTAQQADKHLTVNGKVANKKDSSAIPSVTVYFEKLPYYDDMGMTKSSLDGSFQFSMIEGTSYNFRVEGIPGYEPFEQEITIASDGGSEATVALWIQPEELEELIRLDNLNFNRGSATILPSSFQSLDDFILYLDERPNVLIQLEGHTDFAGNAEANMRLSQARVESVAEYLIDHGVKKTRITTKAFGGSQPLSTERTDEAKRMNRRVEVRLIRQSK